MGKRKSIKYYEELLNVGSKGIFYIDPLYDIGTFDSYHMKFKESIEELINPWNQKPYSPKWYKNIEEMRLIYLKWQKALLDEETQENAKDNSKRINRNYVRNAKIRAEQARLIRIYLQYGFMIPTIARAVEYAEKTVRNSYAYSRHMHLKKNSIVIVKNNSSNQVTKLPFNRYFSRNSETLKPYLEQRGWYLKKRGIVNE